MGEKLRFDFEGKSNLLATKEFNTTDLFHKWSENGVKEKWMIAFLVTLSSQNHVSEMFIKLYFFKNSYSLFSVFSVLSNSK